ncbi:hypothetical protein ALO_21706 [Acetonema longum DSM 6540]|uniref:Uncharacterized protein n=1 Tax=Acetonema longum DSM 6540 TaxID=1009370 RepID=F7NQE2_9FIRM|nr:hypothetical protein ALO_21706 [Acetonema longum DSM 6540]
MHTTYSLHRSPFAGKFFSIKIYDGNEIRPGKLFEAFRA